MKIGNLTIDSYDMRTAISKIAELASSRKGGAVFTANVDHVILSSKDQRFADAYSRATLRLADGMPLVWVSRVLGSRIPERVAGSDLLLPLLDMATDNEFRVFFLGSSEEVCEKAAVKAKEKFRELCIAGTYSPRVTDEVTDEEVKEIMKEVGKSYPHIIIVTLGAPKQEIFIDKARKIYPQYVMLGLGASLDFLAGKVTRAPKWMQKAGLEWCYRLIQEPKRMWHRYLRDAQFPVIVMKEMLK